MNLKSFLLLGLFFILSKNVFPQITCTPASCTVPVGTMISFTGPGGGASNQWDFDYTGPDSINCTGNILNGPAGANYTATGTTASTTYFVPGTYTVVYLRQEFGPPFSSHWCTQVTVTASTSLTLNTTTNDNPCFGYCIGDATVTVTGGTPPYTYNWDDPLTQITQTASNLCAGTYTVLVTDSLGLSDTISVIINQAPQLNMSIIPDTAICLGDSISIFASATGGTGAYNYNWNHSLPNISTHLVSPSFATNYIVVITDSNACSISDSVFVDVYPLPSTPVITQNGNILSTGVATTYQWYLNGSLITGATGQSYTATVSGLYTVEVTNSNGCSAISSPLNVILTNILEATNKIEANIFPNPNNGVFILEINVAEAQDIEIRIINVIGQEVFFEKLTQVKGNYKKEINRIGSSSGIYFLQLKTDNQLIIKKIVRKG